MTTSQLSERPIVRTDAELLALCEELRAAGRFALDTEFMGERTYLPNLCLVQVATTEFIALVDMLAVTDLTPLWELTADPTIEKVLHAAREDLRLAYFGSGKTRPAGIFDTQIAAGFVGLPLYPLGYGRLVEALMGVKLDKSETRSEWDRRPFTPEQVRYARDDVRYLLPIADKLHGLIERLGRANWAAEEMARFSEPGLYETDPELAYLRVRGSRGGLRARPTSLLRSVCAWREREAMARNVPARSFLSDDALTELALRPPRRLTDFARLKSFPRGSDVELGPPLLDALDAARKLPDDALPPPLSGASDDETPRERAFGDLLFALGTVLCLSRDLAPELALARADALALARRRPSALQTGWRRVAVGEELERIVAGQAAAIVTISSGEAVVKIESEA